MNKKVKQISKQQKQQLTKRLEQIYEGAMAEQKFGHALKALEQLVAINDDQKIPIWEGLTKDDLNEWLAHLDAQ